jgi:hypothetical protein
MADGPSVLGYYTLSAHSVERSYVHSSHVASFAVVVDAKEDAVKFYQRYGFMQVSPGTRMFLPMTTIRNLAATSIGE